MPHLILELRPGEIMVVNGATIMFHRRCRVELMSKVHFLFGKQVMAKGEARTDLRRLYFLLQTAYVGSVGEQADAAGAGADLLLRLRIEAGPCMATTLVKVGEALAVNNYHQALKTLRALIREEESPAMIADAGDCRDGL